VEPPLIGIIVGSTRDGRRGGRVAAWFEQIARARDDIRCELIDLLEWDLPWYRDAVVPARGQYTAPETLRWAAKVAPLDGFVLVTPEYNHGYPAALKNALDHLYAEWNHKPVTFVTYGGSAGGVRAAEQLVQVAVELKMAPLRPQVHIPMAGRIFGRDARLAAKPPAGEATAGDEPAGRGRKRSETVVAVEQRHVDAANVALRELAWWARALRAARAAGVPPDR
jgi:NAD(P)H-dependent FMN reductase